MFIYHKRGNDKMTNEEFLEKMNDLYCRYEENSVWRNAKITNALNAYLLKHIKDDELNFQVSIKDYKIVEGAVYLYTDIGTFLFESKEPNLNALDTLKNSSISFLDFFYKLDRKNLSSTLPKKIIPDLPYSKYDSFNLFRYYLFYYYNYRNLTEPKMIHRLFKSYNNGDYVKTVISLEALDNPDFQDFCGTSLRKIPELRKIYDCYHPFEKNENLVFSMSILSEGYEKVEYLEARLEAFKKFVIEEVSKATYLSGYIKICCDYLKKSNLIDQFSKEELFRMYQKNISYYVFLPDVFKETVEKFENKSPTIYLDATKKEKVHIQYSSHQLIEGFPFEHYIRYQIRNEERLRFKNLFLYNNRTIASLYSMYYKNYQKELKEEGNLYDFIGYFFHPKKMISIYNNPNISVATVNDLEQFLPCYDKKVQQGVALVKEELRKRNLALYNSFVGAKDEKEKFDKILLQTGLKEENIYSFIVQNKFLDKKKKEGLLAIVRNHFGEGYSIYDILSIIDEAKSRKVLLDDVLEEKEISKNAFREMYQYAEEDNPILYQCMFDAMPEVERRKYMNYLQFGCHVACNAVKSIEEYKASFPKSPTYYDLIKKLQDTTIAQKLMEKANTFEDFDSSVVPKSFKKK